MHRAGGFESLVLSQGVVLIDCRAAWCEGWRSRPSPAPRAAAIPDSGLGSSALTAELLRWPPAATRAKQALALDERSKDAVR